MIISYEEILSYICLPFVFVIREVSFWLMFLSVSQCFYLNYQYVSQASVLVTFIL